MINLDQLTFCWGYRLKGCCETGVTGVRLSTVEESLSENEADLGESGSKMARDSK